MRRARWIEISADYRCNCNCKGCFSAGVPGGGMSSTEVREALEMGRSKGAERLWLGGGEPTLRRDLFGVVREAKSLGYTTVKLQTNGLMLAYPDYTRKLAEAGISEVNFSIMGARAETHEAHTRTPDSHRLLVRAIGEAGKRGISTKGDLLITSDNMVELGEMVRMYTGLGLGHFNIWLFCAFDQPGPEVQALVPPIREMVPRIVEAMDASPGTAEDFIISLHTPPCTVPPSHHACVFDSARLDMLIANPGGHAFWLEESPIEGGVYLDRCEECIHRPHCDGVRVDYLAIHGDQEFEPVTSGVAVTPGRFSAPGHLGPCLSI